MYQIRALAVVSVVILVGFVIAPSAQADPLVFGNVSALQNDNTTIVDLYSNPGAILFGQQITFLVNISGVLPGGVSNTLQITYHAAGGPVVVQNYDIPLFGTEFPPLTHLFTIPSTGATPGGTPVTLTVDILGSAPDFVLPDGQRVDSYSYSFIVAEPVPEPATLLIMGSGLTGLAIRLRKGRRGAAKS